MLGVTGRGIVSDRYTSELWVRDATAYTTTWGTRGVTVGNAVKIWDVSANQPVLVDSLIVANAGTTGDVQVSDDGTLLAVAIEPRPNGALALYSLANPRKPQLIIRYQSANTLLGVHTAELARVNGKLYAFCSIDPGNGTPSKLVILDLSVPSAPIEVTVLTIGNPYIHDVFVRNGLLFTAEWNDGLGIWDIGYALGSVAAPVRLGRVATVGGQVHNVWWYNAPNGNKRFAFVGEEGPGAIGNSSIGDIHVVDLSNLTKPKEVAVYSVPGAGTHNFSMDESNGFLYAAYYNGGVRMIDVTGDLSTCTAAQKTADGRCDLVLMGRTWAQLVPTAQFPSVYFWGVQYAGGSVFASDMLSGLWRLAPP